MVYQNRFLCHACIYVIKNEIHVQCTYDKAVVVNKVLDVVNIFGGEKLADAKRIIFTNFQQ